MNEQFNLEHEIHNIDKSIELLKDRIHVSEVASRLLDNEDYKTVIESKLLTGRMNELVEILATDDVSDAEEVTILSEMKCIRNFRKALDGIVVDGTTARGLLIREEEYKKEVLNNS